MKKFLSLVLALVMVTSLLTMTGTASAADFTDDDDITYAEAIDVISAIGVVNGYSDGSFKPTGNLTRGAAAKIITNLILGPSTASTLTASVAPFPDVPANHTFAAAIAYCAQNKIISGYGNGNFVPDGPLTGYAFLKMLLGALGYDSAIEGFTGANWAINVAKLADGVGLTEDVVDGFTGTASVDRQTACLFAFNTLKADLVEYDSRITANVGGIDVAIGGNNSAKSVVWASQSSRNSNIVDDNIVQFAERYFPRLIRNSGSYSWDDSYAPGNSTTDTISKGTGYTSDDMGRPAVKWAFKGESIGTYTETPVLTYDGSKTITDIYNDLKLTDSADGWIYINGLPYQAKTNNDTKASAYREIKRTDDTKLSKLSEAYKKDSAWKADADQYGKADEAVIGDGTIVEVFYNDRTNEVIIAAMSVYGGKIAAVKGETSKKDDYVTLDWGTKYPETIDGKGNNEYETTDFAVDDVVAYTYSDKDNSIQSMYKMESVTGLLSKYTVDKNISLGDTTYKYAKHVSFAEGIKQGDLTNRTNYNVYLDKNGYALWIEEAEFTGDNFALILRITSEDDDNAADYTVSPKNEEGEDRVGAWDGNRARLLFADGTKRTVDLDKSYGYKLTQADKDATGGDGYDVGDYVIRNGYRADQVVRYRVNDNGTYRLYSVANETNAGGSRTIVADEGEFKIDNRVMYQADGKDDKGETKWKKMNADSKTIFVVNENGDYTITTGIRNAPNVTGDKAKAYIYTDKSGLAKIVFVTKGSVINSGKSVTFIAGESASRLIDESDLVDYYTYNAVVKGEITTVMIAADQDHTTGVGHSVLTPGEKTNHLVNMTSSNSDGVMLAAGWNDSTSVGHNEKDVYGIQKRAGNDIRVGTRTSDPTKPGAEVQTGALFTLADNAKVFLIDDGGDITAIEIADIVTDPKTQIYYTTDDGDITNLFIVELESD